MAQLQMYIFFRNIEFCLATHQYSFSRIAIIHRLAVPIVASKPAINTQQAENESGNDYHEKIVNYHQPTDIQRLSVLHKARPQNL